MLTTPDPLTTAIHDLTAAVQAIQETQDVQTRLLEDIQARLFALDGFGDGFTYSTVPAELDLDDDD